MSFSPGGGPPLRRGQGGQEPGGGGPLGLAEEGKSRGERGGGEKRGLFPGGRGALQLLAGVGSQGVAVLPLPRHGNPVRPPEEVRQGPWGGGHQRKHPPLQRRGGAGARSPGHPGSGRGRGRPALAVVDSLIKLVPPQQSENEAKVMDVVMARLKQAISPPEREPLVGLVVIHHATKGNGGPRGSGAIAANADHIFRLEPKREGEEDWGLLLYERGRGDVWREVEEVLRVRVRGLRRAGPAPGRPRSPRGLPRGPGTPTSRRRGSALAGGPSRRRSFTASSWRRGIPIPVTSSACGGRGRSLCAPRVGSFGLRKSKKVENLLFHNRNEKS